MSAFCAKRAKTKKGCVAYMAISVCMRREAKRNRNLAVAFAYGVVFEFGEELEHTAVISQVLRFRAKQLCFNYLSAKNHHQPMPIENTCPSLTFPSFVSAHS